MKAAKIIAALGLLAMTGALVYGFTLGDFAAEGRQLLSMPWGVISLVDLYVGFVLFCGWIVYREASLARSAIWVVLMMVLGFWTASLYTLLALQASGGDWRRFWLGRQGADHSLPDVRTAVRGGAGSSPRHQREGDDGSFTDI